MASTLSIIAIIVSLYTLWWTSIMNPKKLILINTKDTGTGMMPEFALINGSKKDLLITTIQCSFSNDNNNSIFTPAQRLEFKESDDFILKSESAFHCKVTFIEPFIEAFAIEGNLENNNDNTFYMHDMYINISWVEMGGKAHKTSIKFIQYGLRKNGEIGRYKPFSKTVELYKNTQPAVSEELAG